MGHTLCFSSQSRRHYRCCQCRHFIEKISSPAFISSKHMQQLYRGNFTLNNFRRGCGRRWRGEWRSIIRLTLSECYPFAITSEEVPRSSALPRAGTNSRWHSCSGRLFGDRFPIVGCSFCPALRSGLLVIVRFKSRDLISNFAVFFCRLPRH
jgi:hypothetical protein